MKNRPQFFQINKVLGLAIVAVFLTMTGCKKDFYELFGAGLTDAFQANFYRAPGIACESEPSEDTFENDLLSYQNDHMLCVDIEIIPEDFEVLRYESRFGPSVIEGDGKTVVGAFMEYWVQCDVPWPSHFNWYTADITIDGIRTENVGIRKKGFLGSIFSPAPSMKINTSHSIAGQTIGETANITFNNNTEDPSRLRSLFNSYIFELVNYPAPRSNLANVRVNNQLLGAYTHIEPVDDDFLLRNFGNNTGDLYEGQLAEFREDWLTRWDPKTDNTDIAYTRLSSFARVMEHATDEEFASEVHLYVDVDRFIQFWALEVLLEHQDGFTANRNNFFIYLDPADSHRITFIPWGFNYYFGQRSEAQFIRNYINAELPRRLSRIPVMRDKFNVELRRLMDEVWNENELVDFIATYSLRVSESQTDPSYQEFIADIYTWINNRRSVVDNMLVEGLPIGNEKGTNSCFGF